MNSEEQRLERAIRLRKNYMKALSAVNQLQSIVLLTRDDKKAVRDGVAYLLRLAVDTTKLVDYVRHRHKEAVRDAAKKHPWFPILVAGRGADANEKLIQIEDFPIGDETGDDWPFKRLKGQAQNDRLWRAIEIQFTIFQEARRGGGKSLIYSKQNQKDIVRLSDLNKETAREWARVMVVVLSEELPEGMKYIRSLKVNIAKETEKKRRRKINQMQKKAKLEGLSEIQASYLQKALQKSEPTKAEAVSSLTDIIEKRLWSRLKK